MPKLIFFPKFFWRPTSHSWLFSGHALKRRQRKWYRLSQRLHWTISTYFGKQHAFASRQLKHRLTILLLLRTSFVSPSDHCAFVNNRFCPLSSIKISSTAVVLLSPCFRLFMHNSTPYTVIYKNKTNYIYILYRIHLNGTKVWTKQNRSSSLCFPKISRTIHSISRSSVYLSQAWLLDFTVFGHTVYAR